MRTVFSNLLHFSQDWSVGFLPFLLRTIGKITGFKTALLLCTRHSSRASFPPTRKWGTGLSINLLPAASSGSRQFKTNQPRRGPPIPPDLPPGWREFYSQHLVSPVNPVLTGLWLHSWHFPSLCLRKRGKTISHSPDPNSQNFRM